MWPLIGGPGPLMRGPGPAPQPWDAVAAEEHAGGSLWGTALPECHKGE